MFPIVREDKWIERCYKKEIESNINYCPTDRSYDGFWNNKDKQKWGICNVACQKIIRKYLFVDINY